MALPRATLYRMRPFAREQWERRDFQLMRRSPVQLFWNMGLLDDSVAWLRDEGYRLIEIDAGEWRSEADLHRTFQERFSFPSYYGRNLDALDECMAGFAVHEFGPDAEATGTVLVLTHFDAFARLEPKSAHAVLDIFASASRCALLIGHRMLCLVQTDDPRLAIEPVGGRPVPWNQREFLDRSRGL